MAAAISIFRVVSPVVSPAISFYSFITNKAEYVKRLEHNLMMLTVQVVTFYSRKKKFDQILLTSVSKEETEEYRILVKQIQVYAKRYEEFISKYQKVCKNLLTPSLAQELDASKASAMIDALEGAKPAIFKWEFFKLAKLSKDVNDLHLKFSEINAKMVLDNVMVEKKPELVQKKPDGDTDFLCMDAYVEKILDYLYGEKEKSVGVVGPIGVGKTTVMRKLNNFQNEPSSTNDIMKYLDSVLIIWIDYPEGVEREDKIIEMLHDTIIGRCKLNRVQGNSMEQNADIISTFLCQKKYLVLFDQVSSTINLYRLGICRTNHQFGKIVVASDSNAVISNMTEVQVRIHPLSKEAALDFFQKVCGTIPDVRIKPIAEIIVESCAGLPLVIEIVAAYLKGESDENVWNGVKLMLRGDKKLLQLGGVEDAYQLVYDGLKYTYLKKCALYGALFPRGHKIYKDYLVECWIAEDFLPLSDVDVPKLRSGRDHGATVLRELTDKCLLEQCSDDKYVTMPDYFRQLALKQKYPGENNCLIVVPEGNIRLNLENWKKATRMSHISCKPEIPRNPESNNLSTLFMQWNPGLVKLGDRFFFKMKNLHVLDLNKTGIESLPTSFSSLVSLVSLYLNDCSRLAKLPVDIRSLVKLEFLDIQGTAIPFLPREIGDLILLRCLRVTFSEKRCYQNGNSKMVNSRVVLMVIRRLRQLEELTIETGCCNETWNDICDQLVNKLINLEKLTTLSFHFPSARSLENFVSNSKSWKNKETNWGHNTFKSFKFSIGCCETQHPYSSSTCGLLAERHLKFSSNDEVSSVKEPLKQTSAFELIGHSNVKTLDDFDLQNTRALRVCVIERCKNLTCIVDADGITQNDVLQCLEKLHLFELPLLQSVWKGSVSPGSTFSSTKVLTLYGCPELTEIFDSKLAKAFSSLQLLRVEKCSKIVEIVKVPDQDIISEYIDASDFLPKLKTLELVNLPELQSICLNEMVNLNLLREIVIQNCNILKDLSLSNMGRLKSIKCEASWWSGVLQWSEEEKQRLFHLCVVL